MQGTGANCYAGMAFRGGFKGMLTELRFFMDWFPDGSKYHGNLVFQGADLPFGYPGAAVEDLVEVGEELHEGWNYYSLLADEDDIDSGPRYAYYRLFNAVSDGCDDIGEVQMIGVQVINWTEDVLNCGVSITKPATG